MSLPANPTPEPSISLPVNPPAEQVLESIVNTDTNVATKPAPKKTYQKKDKTQRANNKGWMEGKRQELFAPELPIWAQREERGWQWAEEKFKEYCNLYHFHFPWPMTHKEEPETLKPYDPRKSYPNPEADLTPAEIEARREHIKEVNARLRRWLDYHSPKDAGSVETANPKRAEDNVFNEFMALSIGVDKKPRQRHAAYAFIDDHYESRLKPIVDNAFNALPKGSKVLKDVNFIYNVARREFDKLPEEEKKKYQAFVKKEGDEAKAKWKEDVEGGPKTDAVSRANAVAHAKAFIGRVNRGIEERTFLRTFTLIGGPMGIYDGQIGAWNIGVSTNKYDAPLTFAEYYGEENMRKLLSVYRAYLETCYTASERKEVVLPTLRAEVDPGTMMDAQANVPQSERDFVVPAPPIEFTPLISFDPEAPPAKKGKGRPTTRAKSGKQAGGGNKAKPPQVVKTVARPEAAKKAVGGDGRKTGRRNGGKKRDSRGVKDVSEEEADLSDDQDETDEEVWDDGGSTDEESSESESGSGSGSDDDIVPREKKRKGNGDGLEQPAKKQRGDKENESGNVVRSTPTDESRRSKRLSKASEPPPASGPAVSAPIPAVAPAPSGVVDPVLRAPVRPLFPFGNPHARPSPPPSVFSGLFQQPAKAPTQVVQAPVVPLSVVGGALPSPVSAAPKSPTVTPTSSNVGPSAVEGVAAFDATRYSDLRKEVPAWLGDAVDEFSAVEGNTDMRQILLMLLEIECLLGFNSKRKETRLPAAKRPQIVSRWINLGRTERTGRLSLADKDTAKFVKSYREWWDAMQPSWRTRGEDGMWERGMYGDGWEKLDVNGGPNGFLSVVAALSYWATACSEGKCSRIEWQKAEEDARWVMVGFLNYVRDKVGPDAA